MLAKICLSDPISLSLSIYSLLKEKALCSQGLEVQNLPLQAMPWARLPGGEQTGAAPLACGRKRPAPCRIYLPLTAGASCSEDGHVVLQSWPFPGPLVIGRPLLALGAPAQVENLFTLAASGSDGNGRAGPRMEQTIDPVPRTVYSPPALWAIRSRAKVRQINEHYSGFGTEPNAGLVGARSDHHREDGATDFPLLMCRTACPPCKHFPRPGAELAS